MKQRIKTTYAQHGHRSLWGAVLGHVVVVNVSRNVLVIYNNIIKLTLHVVDSNDRQGSEHCQLSGHSGWQCCRRHPGRVAPVPAAIDNVSTMIKIQFIRNEHTLPFNDENNSHVSQYAGHGKLSGVVAVAHHCHCSKLNG